ncbi:MAG: protein kinase domain-containing protein [Acidimicrobiales bacterium]
MVVSRLNDQIGRVLGGRYRLTAPIGTGASALVYLADDTRLRRRVAVKLLHQALSADESFLRRFRAEAQAAAALNHPHILAVYDWGEDGDEPYLVTEYLGGGSLRAMLDTGARLDPAQALMIGLETARALDHAHKRGFVHRDIKPANLLFGEDGRLRIADFGLARALAEASWTEPAGAVIGTARYACPEQARGEKVTAKGDVYSLALVLIEAVTGNVPFASDTTIATLMARIDTPIEVSDSLGPLRKVLVRAGNPDPELRPDAGELSVGLLVAAEELARPTPLPLAGTTATVESLAVGDRDPTGLPSSRDDTVANAVPALAPAAELGEMPATPARHRRRASRQVVKEQRAAAIAAGTMRRRRWPRVLAAITAAVAIFAGSFFGYRVLHTPSHSLPSLVTLSEADATAAVLAKHWKVAVNNTRQDGTTAGQVLTQDPPQGKSLQEGKTVTLLVSLGQTTVAVPQDLAGKPVAEATAALQALGLILGVATDAFDENAPKGTVIKLADGTPPELEKGKAIDLVVSQGPEPRTVPSIAVGMPYDQAAKALTDIGLVAGRTDQFDDAIAAGTVIAIAPAAGQQAPRGSTVTITVSKGKPVVPDVKGKSVADAADALQAAGFTIAGVQGNPFRSVSSTTPPAGTPAAKGTGITLVTK